MPSAGEILRLHRTAVLRVLADFKTLGQPNKNKTAVKLSFTAEFLLKDVIHFFHECLHIVCNLGNLVHITGDFLAAVGCVFDIIL